MTRMRRNYCSASQPAPWAADLEGMPAFSGAMLQRLLTPEQRWPRVEGFLHSVLEADARVFKVVALGGSLTTGMNCRSTAVSIVS